MKIPRSPQHRLTAVITRDARAENRVFIKRLDDQKLLFSGCRACFSDLETAFKKFPKIIFRPKIYDFTEFFRNFTKFYDSPRVPALISILLINLWGGQTITQVSNRGTSGKKSCGRLNLGRSRIFLAKFS